MAPQVHAGDGWTSFRNGGPSQASESLPTHWSPRQGIAWEKELVGYGQSAPVIFGGRVYVTAVLGPNCDRLAIECFDLAEGNLAWKFERPTSVGHASNYMNARAAPTPVVDQRGVYAFFETGDLVSVDHSGQQRWHRNEAHEFGKFENNHGIGSSPAADASNVYLLVEHDGPSSLTAIDKDSGDTIWSVERPSTKSWASPIVVDVDGQQQVIVSSGGTMAAYASEDGRQLWEIKGFEGNTIPSPVATDRHLLVAARLPEFAQDGQVKSNACFDLAQLTNGKPHLLWRADKAISEYASPVVAGDHAFYVNKANVLHCIDVSTGKLAYQKRLQLDCWATPIVSGEHIFFFAKNGQTKVIRGGPQYEVVATNSLWDRESPPQPVHYQEANSHSHGTHGSPPPSKSGGSPGSGMLGRLMAGDVNRDGVLEGDEIPGMLRGMMSRVDRNQDERLDRDEVEAMAKSFAERRKGAAASARDPIVYGVAASKGLIAVRTGTRLYVIGKDG